MKDGSRPGVVLTIAGTDPSGAAGVQVDLQVFRDHGFHGTSAITAVVWQNTQEVRGFRALEPDEVGAQIDAVLNDIPIDAVKIGMVPNEAVACQIVARFEKSDIPIVVDTVFASGSGKASLTQDTPRDVAELLLPIATVATPNTHEASQIAQTEVNASNALEIADRLQTLFGPTAILLKAGHLKGDGEIRDILADASGARWMQPLERIADDVRGTGCQLSSAIACSLARGATVEEACEAARAYLNQLLVERRRAIGKGRKVIVRE